MPEEQKAVEIPTVVITNDTNQKTLNLTEMKVKKGKGVGRKYLGLHPSTSGTQLMEFFGAERFFNEWIRPNFNRFSLLISKAATTVSGEGENKTYDINEEKYVSALVKLSPIGQTIAALREMFYELADKIAEPEVQANPEELFRYIAQMQEVRAAIEAKSGSKDKDEDEEEDEEDDDSPQKA